jgi:hypothetical protein
LPWFFCLYSLGRTEEKWGVVDADRWFAGVVQPAFRGNPSAAFEPQIADQKRVWTALGCSRRRMRGFPCILRSVRGAAIWRSGVTAGSLLVAVSCGPAPQARSDVSVASGARAKPERADPCSTKPGQPAVEPLARRYDGLARAARCQPEVLSIMTDVADALGVSCDYCHAAHDFRVATPRKEIGNWMARELVPRLAKHEAGPVTCADCHTRDGKPVAKILGTPRSESRSIEWMTTELVENFTRSDGQPLRCKSCHGGNLGTPEFRRQLLLSDALSPLPVQSPP